jgi:hypothetical protein
MPPVSVGDPDWVLPDAENTVEAKVDVVEIFTVYDDAPTAEFQLMVMPGSWPIAPLAGKESIGVP